MDIPALIAELRGAHRVHTLILYGSRARGDATPESDIDVAGFADLHGLDVDTRLWNGLFLDAFAHPTARAVTPDREVLAQPLLARLDELDRRGPPALSEPEARLRRVWTAKMIARARRGDAEGNYQRNWLLYALLEYYFELRGEWYRGPKVALADLAVRAPEPGAPLEAIRDHAVRVVGADAAMASRP